jgi:hypothetical protein
MFNKLFASISGMGSLQAIITWVVNLIAHLETEAKGPNAKNDAIDAIVEILQAHKTPVTNSPAAK